MFGLFYEVLHWAVPNAHTGLPAPPPPTLPPLYPAATKALNQPPHSLHFTNCSHCYLEMQVRDVVLRSLGTHCHTGCRRGWVDKQAGVLSDSCATTAVYHKPAMLYLSVCLQASCCFLELDFLVGSSSSLVFSKPIYPKGSPFQLVTTPMWALSK